MGEHKVGVLGVFSDVELRSLKWLASRLSICPNCSSLEDEVGRLNGVIVGFVVRKVFPGVVIRGGRGGVEAFMVPDDEGKAFMEFVLDVVPGELEKVGVRFVGVMPHSVSSTREFYPEVYSKAFFGRVVKRKVRKVRKVRGRGL